MAKGGSKVSEVKVDPVMEKPFQRAKRFEQYDYFRKSAYPPMQLEPLMHERSRLAGEGITPEQRALRKQYLEDQILHHEPREVPQVRPLNIFRRIYRLPADLLVYKPLKAIFGEYVADPTRYSVGKIGLIILGTYFMWYHLKYNQNKWTTTSGLVVYQAKPTLFGDVGREYPDKDKADYYDRGFKSRQALLSRE